MLRRARPLQAEDGRDGVRLRYAFPALHFLSLASRFLRGDRSREHALLQARHGAGHRAQAAAHKRTEAGLAWESVPHTPTTEVCICEFILPPVRAFCTVRARPTCVR
eukprot:494375-Prymnesium_polylepis.2